MREDRRSGGLPWREDQFQDQIERRKTIGTG